MSDIAIRVENLGKLYHIGQRQRYKALRDTLTDGMYAPLRAMRSLISGQRSAAGSLASNNYIWALKDISFDVKCGEVIGIIGRNGAGKSTLLKILSRITEPTEGYAEIRGRVGSLLEVGTGFHPELTGRENIYLNGAILGMKKAEIERKFDEIVAFAEVEKFIETPVKHYSSGMYLRLAFAVAAHLDPEILLVDEVLAVGDAAFQRKCLGRMQEVARVGRTVLFVSHNMDAVRKLCNRAALLVQGRLEMFADTEGVLHRYLESGAKSQTVYNISLPTSDDVPGYAYKLIIEDGNGKPVISIPVGQPWQVRVYFRLIKKTEHFIIALGLRSEANVTLRTTWSKPLTLEAGEYQVLFREETIILGTGRYCLVLGLSTYERAIQYVEEAGFLEVAEFSEGINITRVSNAGFVLNPLDVRIWKSD
jgi:lipopolysaccharide transport system ATP-binding protein